MATRRKESVEGKEKRGVSPMGSSTPTERRRSLPPSTPPGTTVARDHGKAPATSSTTGEPRKHVPNYLKPTISSNPDAARQTGVRKHAHDDTHEPTPTMMRRRSFDRPLPPSQVQRAAHSSTARGERTPPFSPKQSASVTRPSSSSSDRTSKGVKAVKSQPPFLKSIKSMPRTSSSFGAKKEVKTSNLKKATPSTQEEPVRAPSTIESEAEDQESLDLNVEEELAKMESPVDFLPEKHLAVDKEHIDEENHSPKEHLDEESHSPKEHLDEENRSPNEHLDEENHSSKEHLDEENHSPKEHLDEENHSPNEHLDEENHSPKEHLDEENHSPNEHLDEENHSPKEHVDETKATLNSTEAIISEDHQDEQEHTPEPVAENAKKVEVTQEEIQVVHASQDTDESDQRSIQAVNVDPAEDGDTKEDEKEKETIEEIKPVGLTVKATPDEKDEEAVEEEQGQHESEGGEGQSSNEPVYKIDEEEKPAKSETENFVHKRQVGGPRNKKESPAYNDVIEETASKLVGKRVNKVRALAGAFETVISLQQPDSS